MKYIFIKSIFLYQQYISPHKKYSCAHNAYYKRGSCSRWAIKCFEKKGIVITLLMMIRRFKRCSMAYHFIMKEIEDEPGDDKKRKVNCLYCLDTAPCIWPLGLTKNN